MKRIIICAVLLAGAVWISVFSNMRVKSVSEEINLRVDSILIALENDERGKITEQAAGLAAYWEEQEKVLVRVIRHSYIDAITLGMVRIPSLAAFEEYGELSAELANIKQQMEHIYSSELLRFSNLL